MKKYIIIITIVLFQVSTLFSQRGKGNHNSSEMTNKSMKKFNAVDAVNILRYDSEKVIKKLKIKDDVTKNTVTKSINTFNREVNEIKFLNTEKLNEVTNYVNIKRSEAMLSRDREAMKSIMQEAKKMLQPIKIQVKDKEDNLSVQLKKVLSEKQFRKWKKYLKAKKQALNPKNNINDNHSKKKQQKRKGMGRGRQF